MAALAGEDAEEGRLGMLMLLRRGNRRRWWSVRPSGTRSLAAANLTRGSWTRARARLAMRRRRQRRRARAWDGTRRPGRGTGDGEDEVGVHREASMALACSCW